MDDLTSMQRFTLVWELEQRYSNLCSLMDLQKLCYDFEECLKSICIKRIVMLSSQIFENVKDTGDASDFIVNNEGKWFIIKAVADLYNERSLNITLSSVIGKGKVVKAGTVKISEAGQYKRINLYIAEDLKVKDNRILKVIESIFCVGYIWYKNKVLQFVHKESVSVASDLYLYLKNIIQNDKLYEKVWLAVVGKGYGFRLLNEEQVKAASMIYKYSRSNINPNLYLVNLVSTKLPYDKILMKHALNYERNITADLKEADYTKNGDLYSLTLTQLYEGDAFSISPLYKGEISLVALYPVDVKERIESIFELNSISIKQVYISHLKKIELAFLLFNATNCDQYDSPSYTEIMNVLEICIQKGYIEKTSDIKKTYILNWLCLNGILKDKQSKYVATQYGRSIMNDSRRMIMNLQVIQNNSGIVTNGGENNKNVLNKCTLTYDNKAINEAITGIRTSVKGMDEEEYVNNAMDMLEKEIKKDNPKKSIIDRIVTSIEGISKISDKLVHLKNILKLLFLV